MPDRIWNRFFAAWYVPPPPHELHREALQLDPQAPRGKLLPDDRRVCFFGDSQMRHLFNNFVMATSAYAAAPVESATKAVMPSDGHTYVVKRCTVLTSTDVRSLFARHDSLAHSLTRSLAMRYAPRSFTGAGFGDEEGAEIAIDSLSCTDIVANMGQWPAGWPEGRPWSFAEYDTAVRGDVDELRAMSATLGVRPERVFWVSTNPYGYLDVHERSLYGNEAADWRWDGVIDGYNEIARAVTTAGGITYVDLSGIVKPLADLPYDGAHYAGIVGNELSWELISELVSADDRS
jgi:hypothetical protein